MVKGCKAENKGNKLFRRRHLDGKIILYL